MSPVWLSVRSCRRVPVRCSISIRATPAWTRLVEAWLALTFAVNSINRSMGLRDLYPFVLGPLAVAKLTFVQQRIVAVSSPDQDDRGAGCEAAREPRFQRRRPRDLACPRPNTM